MTREQLIQKGSQKVRTETNLFELFRQFIIEDWGNIPGDCFGCQFNTYFNQWSSQVLNKNITKMENKQANSKHYILKDKSTHRYLFGKVYSNHSSDADWVEYLTHNPSGASMFNVYPLGYEINKTQTEEELDYKKKVENKSTTSQDVVVNKKRGRKAK